LRLITDKDEEMLRTIEFSSRLTHGDALLRHFLARGEAPGSTADDWFFYGLAAWALMGRVSHSSKKHEYLVAALDGFSSACKQEDDHWPAMFMRSTIITMLSDTEVDEMTVYLLPTTYTVDDAAQERRRMLALQLDHDVQPYFFVTYAAIALDLLHQGRPDEARSMIGQGLSTVPAGRVASFGAHLVIPVALLDRELAQGQDEDLRSQVRGRFTRMFSGLGSS
jgi:hypothetical protein